MREKGRCRVFPRVTECGVEVLTPTVDCKPFKVCLGMGRELIYNGACFVVSGNPAVPDGWYGEVRVEGGCITGAREASLPLYTPLPCTPAPGGSWGGVSGGGGGGAGAGGSLPLLTSSSCNLTHISGGALNTELVFGALSGLTITGCGTASSPLNISVTGGGGGVGSYVGSGSPGVITVSGSGSFTSPYMVGLSPSGVTPGAYSGFTIDQYGRVTDYTAPPGSSSAITSVVSGTGIQATTFNGVVTIGLVPTGVSAGSYLFGGYDVGIDSSGRVQSVSTNINITAGTYAFGNISATVNSLGSITGLSNLVPNAYDPGLNFVKIFSAGAGSNNIRSMVINTAATSLLHIVYEGYLGVINMPNVVSSVWETPAEISLEVDGVLIPSISFIDHRDAAFQNPRSIVKIEGLTYPVSAGQHTIEISHASPPSLFAGGPGIFKVYSVSTGY